MKPKRTLILLSFVIAVLSLAVAYAAITNVDFTISGTAAATAEQGNFKIAITNATISGDEESTITVNDDNMSATINIVGKTNKTIYLDTTLDITNSSSDIYALTKLKTDPQLIKPTSGPGGYLQITDSKGNVACNLNVYVVTPESNLMNNSFDTDGYSTVAAVIEPRRNRKFSNIFFFRANRNYIRRY